MSTIAAARKPHSGIYFGWRIVLALFIATFVLFGVSIYAFVMLTTPLSAVHNWTPAQTGSLVSAMWIAAPLSLLSAPFINRFGAWPVLGAGFTILAATTAGLVLITEFWHLYLLRIAMGVGKIMVAVTVPIIVMRWFSRRFATAVGVAWAGGSAGGMVMSPLTEWLIASFGWVSTTLVLAAGIVVCTLIIAVLARGPTGPGDLGLAPDGAPAREATTIQHREVEQWSISRTLKSINWLTATTMFVGIIGLGICGIAVISQEPVLMRAAGIPDSAAAAILGLIAGASVVGAMASGWLLDRFPAFVASLVISALIYSGLAAFYVLETTQSVALGAFAAFGMGYSMGAGEILWINLTKRQFGEAAFPTTYGGWYLALQIGYALGGGLAGLTFEHLGTTGFLVFVALMYLPSAAFTIWRPGIRQ